MKKYLLLLIIFLNAFFSNAQITNSTGVGAGFGSGGLAPSAIMEARSTTKGFLFPRMTSTQRNAIASPATSLVIFNTTTGAYNYYDGDSWETFGGGGVSNLQTVLNSSGHAESTDDLFNIDLDLFGKQIAFRAQQDSSIDTDVRFNFNTSYIQLLKSQLDNTTNGGYSELLLVNDEIQINRVSSMLGAARNQFRLQKQTTYDAEPVTVLRAYPDSNTRYLATEDFVDNAINDIPTPTLQSITTGAGNNETTNGLVTKSFLYVDLTDDTGSEFYVDSAGVQLQYGGFYTTLSNENITNSRSNSMPDTDGVLAVISQTVTNGETHKSPSEDAVSDAIARNSAAERTVKIIAQSDIGDGYNFHSFLSVGNALYGGERSSGSRGARFYKFPDKNDLSISEYIEMTNEGAGIKGFESVTYDSGTGNFYALLSNTSSIITIPANNISAYTITTITGMPSGCFFRGSGGIVNDGTHLYVGTETIPNSFVLKILISTLAVVDDYEWPRAQIHAANINLDNGYAVFTTSGSDCYLLKVNLSDFSHQELQLNLDVVTDDFAIANSFDFAFIGGEGNLGSEIGGVAVDLANMISYPLNCLPSTGFFYDGDNSLVINTSILGFVETYEIFDIIDAVVSGIPNQLDVVKSYNLRSGWANEFTKSGDDYFVTLWDNTDGFGIVKKIELLDYNNPLVSREEIRSRFNSSNSGVTSITATSPLTGGTITTTGSLGIQDAAADNTTKGASSFSSSDFNDSLGNISLDITNGQSASTSTKGYLTSTDWNTFNSKASVAYTDAKVSDAVVDGVTTVAPSQNAVADALAIRKKHL